VQSPVPATFMCKREPVAPFYGRPFFRIEAFVNDDLARLQPDRPEDVRLDPKPPNAEPAVQVIKLDVKLKVLLDDLLNRDRRLYLCAFGVGIVRKQGLGVAFNFLVRDKGPAPFSRRYCSP
jgi:hypothetical protein